MYTKDAIRFSLTLAGEATLSSVAAIEDAPLTFPTAQGGCHPLWVIGHLALVEAMTHELLGAGANPIAHWGPLFGPNSVPTANAADYPKFEEVKSRYEQLRQRTLDLLDSFTDADLDKRVSSPPPGLETHFATYGKALLTLSLHQALHRSHITDAVRAAGREVPSPLAA